ncbi:MAG: RidA family protein [Gammaproteobacteria bacterium]|nr:RidA family protein [Gammaproteobacteria bacterium]
MSRIEQRLQELGIVLPPPMDTSKLPFELTRIEGNRVLLSGHVPFDVDGRLLQPLGKVGAEVTPEQGALAARHVALGLMASLKQALGDLDRVRGWLRLFGMVNVAPDLVATTPVINGASEVILEVFGPEIGSHTRSAIGVAALPFAVPVEIEAEVVIR